MRVLITGITGSTGSHLSDQLIDQGHVVAGLVRGQREPVLYPGQREYRVVRGDLTDFGSLVAALRDVMPERIYHLGAVTSIGQSWHQQELMTNVTGMGTLRLLQAVRIVCPNARVVIASSADQFGDYSSRTDSTWADEYTPFAPRSPYAVAKQFGHDTALTYREAYNLHVSTLLLFNHTGPRHGPEFVVRKVTDGAALIAREGAGLLRLGDLTVQRDWGYAPDYARAYPLAADQDDPGDYVIATGNLHSLQHLCEVAFDVVNLNWSDHVRFDEKLVRPTNVDTRVGDATRARLTLDWVPQKSFEDTVSEMVRTSPLSR